MLPYIHKLFVPDASIIILSFPFVEDTKVLPEHRTIIFKGLTLIAYDITFFIAFSFKFIKLDIIRFSLIGFLSVSVPLKIYVSPTFVSARVKEMLL